MRKRRWAALAAILAVMMAMANAQAAVAWGDKGQDVTKIQQRLRQYGYMDAPADGIFGQATYNAVIRFQKKNGLKADGVVGPATAAALGVALSGSGGSAAAGSYNES